MEIKQIRMGIVGAGTWGRTHASIYAEHLFADPVAICDMNEARAREIADEFGIRKVYTDYHDMAADEEIDAVAIVTPDFAHADIACAMADAKKDILIEKPLATTKEDIARICGVGVSTVSRAINNHPDINPETKEMIMRVIKENNYVPNNSARNLKRQDAKAIAVLVKGINNSFFSQMIKVLEEEIKEKSYAMVLQHVDYDEDEVEVALKLVKEKRLRGIIFLGGYLVHSEEKLAQLHVPFILSTTGMLPKGFSRNTYSSVAVDDTKESYKMVDYLCKNGHKDIAILCARKTDASIGKLRLEGYKKALKDNGIEVREELILPMRSDLEDYSLENGYMVTKEFLEKQIPCTAIFAISDMLAIGAGKALSDAGYKVPEDISLAGFDGVEIGKYVIPSLTTLKQPVDSMARETARILFDIIGKKAKHQHCVFDGELVVRDSTMPRT